MIKVQIQPVHFGYILKPVSEKVCKRVAHSNQYDGRGDVYIYHDYDIQALFERLNSSQRKNITNGWSVSILIDEWEFRHMVGGQSD